MENKTVKKVVETILVIVSLVIAFAVYQKINPEKFVKPDSTPVTMEEIAAAPQENYAGKAAGEDITRITGREEFENLTEGAYVTAEPVKIVKTGIYGIKPWVDPYEITKVRGSKGRMVSSGRRAPEVTDNVTNAAGYYQEYYLIELQDGTMIPAQFGEAYLDKIEKGKKITLPIGCRKTNSNEAREYLEDIGEKNGVDTTYTLYMIDDNWQEENHFKFVIIRFGISAVVFFVVAVLLVYAFEKISTKGTKL